jgi:ATP-dependent Clp protease adaptor protein ClpS
MTQSRVETTTQINVDIKEPPQYRVIYINDDTTSMEFVILSLMTHFGHDESSATKITMSIHEAGSAVVAVLPYEIAEQKGIEVTLQARQQGFSLQIKLEPDQS